MRYGRGRFTSPSVQIVAGDLCAVNLTNFHRCAGDATEKRVRLRCQIGSLVIEMARAGSPHRWKPRHPVEEVGGLPRLDYDQTQKGAVLTLCEQCERWYYMTHPQPVCIACKGKQ